MQVRRALSIRELINEAKKGNAEAQSDLGYRYENGDGVKQSYQEAAKWYALAAEQGENNAQNNLGTFYEWGNGVEIDFKKALELYTKAAEQGNPNAQFNAGHDLSKARFEHNLKLRINDPNYQNSGSTNRWLYECMYVHKRILKQDFLSKIPADILILKAGCDTVVYTKPYDILVKYLPNCRVHEYPDSRHSIYNSDDETLLRYWKEVFEFLQ